MANINSYASDQTIHANDKLIGSDGTTGADFGKTKNFTVGDIKDYVISFLDETTTLSTTVTLTPTQLLSFNGGGQIEILPQPETGKAYIVKAIYFHLDFNTTAYDFSTNIYLGSYDPNAVLEAPRWSTIYASYLNKTSDTTTFQGDVAGSVIVEGYPIYLYHPLVSVTQGDSTVKIRLDYQIIDLSL